MIVLCYFLGIRLIFKYRINRYIVLGGKSPKGLLSRLQLSAGKGTYVLICESYGFLWLVLQVCTTQG